MHQRRQPATLIHLADSHPDPAEEILDRINRILASLNQYLAAPRPRHQPGGIITEAAHRQIIADLLEWEHWITNCAAGRNLDEPRRLIREALARYRDLKPDLVREVEAERASRAEPEAAQGQPTNPDTSPEEDASDAFTHTGETPAAHRAARDAWERVRAGRSVLDASEALMRLLDEPHSAVDALEADCSREELARALRAVAASEGLSRIPVEPGDTYDPALHQPAGQHPAEPGGWQVGDVLVEGYALQGAVIRRPIVSLNAGWAQPGAPSAPGRATPVEAHFMVDHSGSPFQLPPGHGQAARSGPRRSGW